MIGGALGLAANASSRVPVRPGPADPADVDRNGVNDRLDWVAQNIADPVGKVFLRLMFMVVVPLVFSALALGVVGLGDVRRLGRVGLKTLAFTAGFSLTAVAIGIVLVNTIRPGAGLSRAERDALRAQYAQEGEGVNDAVRQTVEKARRAKPLRDTLLDIIPENPLQEMVGALDGSSKGNGMLAVMFFSLAFGIALSTLGERGRPMVDWLASLFDVTMVVIGFAMRLAPVAVACLVFAMLARLGLAIVGPLLWFMATVLIGLAIHLVVVYSAALVLFARRRPMDFFRDVSEAMLTAFGTSSSNATLPTALRVARDKLGLPPEISQFVLTVGSTGNQNGTALYEGVTVLFLAQLFGQDLSLAQQVTVVLMSVLAGVGTAGVPGGSLPLIVVVLQSTGVPAEGIGVILGIDRILDMCRTVLNVTGDLAVAACVSATTETADDP